MSEAQALSPLKKALVALDKLQRRLDDVESRAREPIAVIGIGCRTPGGVRNPESLWRLLRAGVDAITEVPKERWDLDVLYDPDRDAPGKMYTRSGGFLEDVDRFDAGYFGIAPREAVSLDPQHRLVLETSWEALEHAGQTKERLMGSRTGVYMGICFDEYSQLHLYSPDAARIDAYSFTGTAASMLTGRLSYSLGLQGPSVTVDTACSSSLVTVHLACQALRAAQCDLALAGGVNLILGPENTIYFCKVKALSPDGRCKTFDASADGYVRGEGCGVVVLKRLSDALRDRDPVLALVRGSAINQDGRSNGLTAPNGPSQERVIRDALQDAGVNPAQVGYVEAHGTGTPLGDPIEVRALGNVYREGRDRPLLIGSVKTNMGHLEGAAGVVGLIKAVLALGHGEVPPHLHFRRLNPMISLAEIPAEIPTSPRPWPASPGQRFAGVSSFGISGTNAHVILQDAPVAEPVSALAGGSTEGRLHVLPVSAHTPEALVAMARAYRDLVAGEEAPALADLCYSASVRRSHHEHRLAIVTGSRADTLERLDAFLDGELRPGLASGRKELDERPKVVFVFPGQGSQWVGMARELMEREPVFGDTIARCEEALGGEVSWSLREQLALPESSPKFLLNQIDVIQPALFSIQVALAAVWRSWGIAPDAVVGHSMGEVAAAHVAGALSLSDAAAIICRRSRLLRGVSGRGAMAVVGLSLEGAREALGAYADRLSIAVSNGPNSTVLSGDPGALKEVLDGLQQRDVFCRPVQVDVASHSPQMDPLLAELRRELQGIAPTPPSVPMYSTVTGRAGSEVPLDSAYWARNLREPVLFSTAIERLLEDGHGVFLEQSPHPILLPAIEGMLHHLGREGAVLPSMERDKAEVEVALGSLGAMYVLGQPVAWERINPPGRCVVLPPYAWQRKRFWFGDKSPRAVSPSAVGDGHPLLGRPLPELAHLPGSRFWERTLSGTAAVPSLGQRVLGVPVLHGASFLEMARAAASEAFGSADPLIEGLTVESVLAMADERPLILQTVVTPAPGRDSEGSFRVFRGGGSAGSPHHWALVARAELRSTTPGGESTGVDLDKIRRRCSQDVSPRAHSAMLQQRGLDLGRSGGGVEELHRGASEALARIAQEERGDRDAPPDASLLGTCLSVLLAAAPEGGPTIEAALVPVSVERFRSIRPPGSRVWVHAEVLDVRPLALTGNVRLLDDGGRLVVEALGVRLQAAESPSLREATERRVAELRYEIAWRERARSAPGTRATSKGASWLIFADRGGVASALARLLRERGDRCTLAFAGAAGSLGEGDLAVEPADAAAIGRVLEVACEGGKRKVGVVHLWSLDAAPADHLDPGALSAAHGLGCISALHIAQTAGSADESQRLWLVTRGAEPVGSEGLGVGLAQSPLWGFGRVLALERPASWGGLVDLDPGAPTDEARALLGEIVDGDGEDQVAFRNGRRYVARLARAAISGDPHPLVWRRDGSYLITGGLGGLGLQVARWMASQGAGHLVLTSRRGLPERAGWDDVPPGSPAARQVAAVRSLESAGATVTVFRADAGDPQRMGALFELFGRTLPPLHGIVHAAGVLTTESIEDLRPDTFRGVLRPKVEGAWALHVLARAQPVDFFVLFSSGASVWGSKGFGHYAAANHFLDSLAHYRRAEGQPALSVNWGWWAGGGITSEEGERFFHQIGLDLMPSGLSLSALNVLLRVGAVQGTVAAVDWSVFKPIYESRGRRPFLEEIEVSAGLDEGPVPRSTGDLLARLKAARPADRRELLASHIGSEVARILGFDSPAAVERRLGFFKMGMDSIMTVQLRNRLEAGLGRKLPPTVAFEYPTVDGLAGYLLAEVSALDLARESAHAPQAPEPAATEGVPEVDDRSEEELTALLAERLRQTR